MSGGVINFILRCVKKAAEMRVTPGLLMVGATGLGPVTPTV